MQEDDGEPRGWAAIDRSKVYLVTASAALLVALVGVWLTPVAAEIGRREIGASYIVGEVILMAGGIVALICVALAVVDS